MTEAGRRDVPVGDAPGVVIRAGVRVQECHCGGFCFVRFVRAEQRPVCESHIRRGSVSSAGAVDLVRTGSSQSICHQSTTHPKQGQIVGFGMTDLLAGEGTRWQGDLQHRHGPCCGHQVQPELRPFRAIRVAAVGRAAPTDRGQRDAFTHAA